jgi:hypothetical protein
VRDKEHGLQFKAQVLKAVPPTTGEGVERYLGGGFVKRVGPVLARPFRRRLRDRLLHRSLTGADAPSRCVWFAHPRAVEESILKSQHNPYKT